MGFFDFLKRLWEGPPPAPPRDRPAGGGSPRNLAEVDGFSRPAAPLGRAPVAPTPRQAPPPPQRTTLNLAMGNLQPMSDAQVMAGAKSLWRQRWSWGWNARDRIPSVNDPRARLIEQGMLGRGLVSTEQLARMHEVGAEYDKVRPYMQKVVQEAHRQAADQVAAGREARAQQKAQKQAESAARKRRRAEAVATRRQTEIDYLGRGVSAGLADRRANPEKLTQLGLPHLATAGDIAKALGIGISQVRFLAFHSESSAVSHYVSFTVPKKSGGLRQLAAPQPKLAACQQWILTEILAKLPTHAAAHGFVPGRSTLTNAQAHIAQGIVVNADLTDFFPSITFPRVRGLFRALGYSPAAATILALLCTECPRRRVDYAGTHYHVAIGPRALPQGACTSPALSNLVAKRLDSRLQGLAATLGWTYTRYADDLTLSCKTGADDTVGYLLARLRHIARDEGFSLNEKKTRVQRPNSRQSVTGLVVNHRPAVPRPTVRRLRAILHQARTTGLAAQNRDGHPNFTGWVQGMIAYIYMANPEQGQALFRDLALVLDRES